MLNQIKNPRHSLARKLMSSLLVFTFILSTLSPYVQAQTPDSGAYTPTVEYRDGTYPTGWGSAGAAFGMGAFAGVVTCAAILLSAGAGHAAAAWQGMAVAVGSSFAADVAGAYMYYYHYETSGETAIRFKVFGADIKMTKGQVVSMVVGIVASVAIGFAANAAAKAVDKPAEQAAEALAKTTESAAQSATQSAAQSTANSITTEMLKYTAYATLIGAGGGALGGMTIGLIASGGDWETAGDYAGRGAVLGAAGGLAGGLGYMGYNSSGILRSALVTTATTSLGLGVGYMLSGTGEGLGKGAASGALIGGAYGIWNLSSSTDSPLLKSLILTAATASLGAGLGYSLSGGKADSLSEGAAAGMAVGATIAICKYGFGGADRSLAGQLAYYPLMSGLAGGGLGYMLTGDAEGFARGAAAGAAVGLTGVSVAYIAKGDFGSAGKNALLIPLGAAAGAGAGYAISGTGSGAVRGLAAGAGLGSAAFVTISFRDAALKALADGRLTSTGIAVARPFAYALAGSFAGVGMGYAMNPENGAGRGAVLGSFTGASAGIAEASPSTQSAWQRSLIITGATTSLGAGVGYAATGDAGGLGAGAFGGALIGGAYGIANLYAYTNSSILRSLIITGASTSAGGGLGYALSGGNSKWLKRGAGIGMAVGATAAMAKNLYTNQANGLKNTLLEKLVFYPTMSSLGGAGIGYAIGGDMESAARGAAAGGALASALVGMSYLGTGNKSMLNDALLVPAGMVAGAGIGYAATGTGEGTARGLAAGTSLGVAAAALSMFEGARDSAINRQTSLAAGMKGGLAQNGFYKAGDVIRFNLAMPLVYGTAGMFAGGGLGYAITGDREGFEKGAKVGVSLGLAAGMVLSANAFSGMFLRSSLNSTVGANGEVLLNQGLGHALIRASTLVGYTAVGAGAGALAGGAAATLAGEDYEEGAGRGAALGAAVGFTAGMAGIAMDGSFTPNQQISADAAGKMSKEALQATKNTFTQSNFMKTVLFNTAAGGATGGVLGAGLAYAVTGDGDAAEEGFYRGAAVGASLAFAGSVHSQLRTIAPERLARAIINVPLATLSGSVVGAGLGYLFTGDSEDAAEGAETGALIGFAGATLSAINVGIEEKLAPALTNENTYGRFLIVEGSRALFVKLPIELTVGFARLAAQEIAEDSLKQAGMDEASASMIGGLASMAAGMLATVTVAQVFTGNTSYMTNKGEIISDAEKDQLDAAAFFNKSLEPLQGQNVEVVRMKVGPNGIPIEDLEEVVGSNGEVIGKTAKLDTVSGESIMRGSYKGNGIYVIGQGMDQRVVKIDENSTSSANQFLKGMMVKYADVLGSTQMLRTLKGDVIRDLGFSPMQDNALGGFWSMASMGPRPLVTTAAKVAALALLDYTTYRGDIMSSEGKEKIYKNSLKMAVANAVGGFAGDLSVGWQSSVNGINPWGGRPYQMSFTDYMLRNLFVEAAGLGADIAFAAMGHATGINSNEGMALGHLAASVLAGSIIDVTLNRDRGLGRRDTFTQVNSQGDPIDGNSLNRQEYSIEGQRLADNGMVINSSLSNPEEGFYVYEKKGDTDGSSRIYYQHNRDYKSVAKNIDNPLYQGSHLNPFYVDGNSGVNVDLGQAATFVYCVGGDFLANLGQAALNTLYWPGAHPLYGDTASFGSHAARFGEYDRMINHVASIGYGGGYIRTEANEAAWAVDGQARQRFVTSAGSAANNFILTPEFHTYASFVPDVSVLNPENIVSQSQVGAIEREDFEDKQDKYNKALKDYGDAVAELSRAELEEGNNTNGDGSVKDETIQQTLVDRRIAAEKNVMTCTGKVEFAEGNLEHAKYYQQMAAASQNPVEQYNPFFNIFGRQGGAVIHYNVQRNYDEYKYSAQELKAARNVAVAERNRALYSEDGKTEKPDPDTTTVNTANKVINAIDNVTKNGEVEPGSGVFASVGLDETYSPSIAGNVLTTLHTSTGATANLNLTRLRRDFEGYDGNESGIFVAKEGMVRNESVLTEAYGSLQKLFENKKDTNDPEYKNIVASIKSAIDGSDKDKEDFVTRVANICEMRAKNTTVRMDANDSKETTYGVNDLTALPGEKVEVSTGNFKNKSEVVLDIRRKLGVSATGGLGLQLFHDNKATISGYTTRDRFGRPVRTVNFGWENKDNMRAQNPTYRVSGIEPSGGDVKVVSAITNMVNTPVDQVSTGLIVDYTQKPKKADMRNAAGQARMGQPERVAVVEYAADDQVLSPLLNADKPNAGKIKEGALKKLNLPVKVLKLLKKEGIIDDKDNVNMDFAGFSKGDEFTESFIKVLGKNQKKNSGKYLSKLETLLFAAQKEARAEAVPNMVMKIAPSAEVTKDTFESGTDFAALLPRLIDAGYVMKTTHRINPAFEGFSEDFKKELESAGFGLESVNDIEGRLNKVREQNPGTVKSVAIYEVVKKEDGSKDMVFIKRVENTLTGQKQYGDTLPGGINYGEGKEKRRALGVKFNEKSASVGVAYPIIEQETIDANNKKKYGNVAAGVAVVGDRRFSSVSAAKEAIASIETPAPDGFEYGAEQMKDSSFAIVVRPQTGGVASDKVIKKVFKSEAQAQRAMAAITTPLPEGFEYFVKKVPRYGGFIVIKRATPSGENRKDPYVVVPVPQDNKQFVESVVAQEGLGAAPTMAVLTNNTTWSTANGGSITFTTPEVKRDFSGVKSSNGVEVTMHKKVVDPLSLNKVNVTEPTSFTSPGVDVVKEMEDARLAQAIPSGNSYSFNVPIHNMRSSEEMARDGWITSSFVSGPQGALNYNVINHGPELMARANVLQADSAKKIVGRMRFLASEKVRETIEGDAYVSPVKHETIDDNLAKDVKKIVDDFTKTDAYDKAKKSFDSRSKASAQGSSEGIYDAVMVEGAANARNVLDESINDYAKKELGIDMENIDKSRDALQSLPLGRIEQFTLFENKYVNGRPYMVPTIQGAVRYNAPVDSTAELVEDHVKLNSVIGLEHPIFIRGSSAGNHKINVSGHELLVRAGETISEAAKRAGIDVSEGDNVTTIDGRWIGKFTSSKEGQAGLLTKLDVINSHDKSPLNAAAPEERDAYIVGRDQSYEQALAKAGYLLLHDDYRVKVGNSEFVVGNKERVSDAAKRAGIEMKDSDNIYVTMSDGKQLAVKGDETIHGNMVLYAKESGKVGYNEQQFKRDVVALNSGMISSLLPDIKTEDTSGRVRNVSMRTYDYGLESTQQGVQNRMQDAQRRNSVEGVRYYRSSAVGSSPLGAGYIEAGQAGVSAAYTEVYKERNYVFGDNFDRLMGKITYTGTGPALTTEPPLKK